MSIRFHEKIEKDHIRKQGKHFPMLLRIMRFLNITRNTSSLLQFKSGNTVEKSRFLPLFLHKTG